MSDLEEQGFTKIEIDILRRCDFDLSKVPSEFQETHADLLADREVDSILYKLEEAIAYVNTLNKQEKGR